MTNNFSRDKVLYGDKFMSLMWVTDAIEAAEHHLGDNEVFWNKGLKNVLSALIA